MAGVGAICLLQKGRQNALDLIRPGEAARMLLANVLLFGNDRELVRSIFDSACDLVAHVPAYRLTFFPDERVWELIT
jgi:hypothetical protein